LAVSKSFPQLNAQLRAHDLHEIAAGLLAWVDTLTEPTGEVWRVPRGDSVHLSTTGRLPHGPGIQIYGAVPFTEHGPGGRLAPDTTAPLLLGALRHLTDSGQVPT
ncbi:MAG: hypothetical protein ACRDTC_08815, partial [Pseudonocardiaceae bacterium]